MAKITTKKDNNETTHESLNKACEFYGATSGKNKIAAVKWLWKNDIEIVNGVDETTIEQAKQGGTRKSTTIIERIMKKLAKPDDEKIAELVEKQQAMAKTAKTMDDIKKFNELGKKIELERNPKVSRESIHAYIDGLINDHNDNNDNKIS